MFGCRGCQFDQSGEEDYIDDGLRTSKELYGKLSCRFSQFTTSIFHPKDLFFMTTLNQFG